MLSLIICKARLLCILAIVCNLTFQCMALFVHLSAAHPGRSVTGFHISLPSGEEDHHDCPVCLILSTLHPSLAAGLDSPMPFFLLYAEKVYTQTSLCFHADTRIYDPRAPPPKLPEA